MEVKKENKMFGGINRQYSHQSSELGCSMVFTVFLPPQALAGQKVPVLYYLSGLTCTDENVITKAGAQRKCAELGIAFVAPDTSPRGLNVEGESESWDFGVGAGFYLDATVEKWKNWRMYSYITKELPALLKSIPELDTEKASITGHSMGGHGALVLGLKHPELYLSISAFAPICNPTQVPWGQKAFSGYLGSDESMWQQYDACVVARTYHGPARALLVDTGTGDSFLERELKPERLVEAVSGNSNLTLESRMQPGYDHSYFFMATFIDDHIAHHAKYLLQ